MKTSTQPQSGTIEDDLSSIMGELNDLENSLNSMHSNIGGIQIDNAQKIVNPITTKIQPIVAEKTYLNYIFSGLLTLVIMFISILLSTTIVMMEKTSPSYFRNFITPKMQVQALTAFMIESLGLYRFAILYPDENYGTTFMNLFWDQLLESGGVVVGAEAYEPKQTDFSDPIKKLVGLYYEIPDDLKAQVVSETKTDEGVLSENPEDDPNENNTAESDEEEEPESIVDFDAIFIPDSPKKAGLIIPQLAYYDIKDVYLLGTNLWHSESLIKIADQYVQGAIMPDGFFAGSKSPQVRNFVELFKNTYQETPEFIEAILYDSAMILFQVVSEPSIRFRSEIRDGLLNMNDYPGVTGMTRFDENGDVLRRLYLLRVKGKTFVELE